MTQLQSAEATADRYTKDNPRVVCLSETTGMLRAVAAGTLKVKDAYLCVVDGIPTKVVRRA